MSTEEGHEFAGWYADAECTAPFDFDQPIREDTVIYAKWTDWVTLSVGVYDKTNSRSGQGGSYTFNAEDMTHTVDKHRAVLGSEVTLVAAPAEGYRFEGWTLGSVTGGDGEMVIQPLNGDLLNTEPVIQFEAGPAYAAYALCALFREVGDTPPEIDISTLQIQVPEERQSSRIVTAGDKVTVSVKITDDGTITKALAYLLHDHENIPGDDESYIRFKKITLSRQDGDIWTGEFNIEEDTDIGEWQFGYLEVTDNNNNKVNHYNSGGYYE